MEAEHILVSPQHLFHYGDKPEISQKTHQHEPLIRDLRIKML